MPLSNQTGKGKWKLRVAVIEHLIDLPPLLMQASAPIGTLNDTTIVGEHQAGRRATYGVFQNQAGVTMLMLPQCCRVSRRMTSIPPTPVQPRARPRPWGTA